MALLCLLVRALRLDNFPQEVKLSYFKPFPPFCALLSLPCTRHHSKAFIFSARLMIPLQTELLLLEGPFEMEERCRRGIKSPPAIKHTTSLFQGVCSTAALQTNFLLCVIKFLSCWFKTGSVQNLLNHRWLWQILPRELSKFSTLTCLQNCFTRLGAKSYLSWFFNLLPKIDLQRKRAHN